MRVGVAAPRQSAANFSLTWRHASEMPLRQSAVIIFTLVAILACIAAPDIDSVSPLAIRPDVQAEITLSGSDLSDATQLWTSFPARVERIGGAKFRLMTDAPVGLGALRVFGSNGISNLRFVMVDDLPIALESNTNKARASAQPIQAGTAIEGHCDELSYDWFRLHLKKGERLSLEAVAARLGSRLDSVLRVFNSAGRELARNDDAPGQSGDSVLNFITPEAGEYFVELRDVNYGGGPAFFYRLRVGGAPIRPGYLKTNSTQQLQVISEREPNDTPAKATKVTLTETVRGTFNRAGDRDCYEFSGRQGERLEFRTATRSLGSACDAVLELYAADGKRLARSNPSAADEGVLTHSFASNGTYHLIVEEATRTFGPDMFYEVSARPAAGFVLTLDADRVNVAPEKAFELKVNITRGDYKGAVALRLERLPEAFTWTNNIIAEGKSNVTMRVIAPATLVPGTWQTFSVIGMAKRDGTKVEARASTAPALRKLLPLRLYPPPEFDGEVALGITAK